MNQRSLILGVVGGCAVVIILLGLGFWLSNRPIAEIPSTPPSLMATTSLAGAASPAPVTTFSPVSAPVKALMTQADQALTEGRWPQARQLYQKILQNHPDSAAASEVQQKLGEVNVRLLFSPNADPGAPFYTSYEVQSGDTLGRIARQHKTTVGLIQKANGLAGDKILVGRSLKIPTIKFSMVVDKSQNALTLKAGEEVIKTYSVSTGKDNSTPIGTFTIVNKLVDPPWYTAQGVVPAGSPENILGTRWMGFSKPGFGIHGTTDPATIGKAVTAGCVRMRNNEVEELYTMIPLGTEITIVD
ncbi:MAG: L,D-transpeptidase family protein [Candidatus Omnitrophica bacterium]|nr:L,D-transpeptidase family protein [Candidatus Omnitrophota bacterium]